MSIMKLIVMNQLSEAEQVEYDNDEQTVKVFFHEGCDLEGLDMALELPYAFVLDLFEDMMKKAEVDMLDVVTSTTVSKDGQDCTFTITATKLPDNEEGGE